MADLADLAALKAQLEAEQEPADDSGVSDLDSTENSASDGNKDVLPDPTADLSDESENIYQVVVAAVLRHTRFEATEFSRELTLRQLEIGSIARWAIASTIETELGLQLADSDVLAWKTIGDILVSAEEE